MTIVLVHGNPEVAEVWSAMTDELGRDDVVALSPPGFGSRMPEGFGSTAPEYAQWLVGEIGRLPGPIHLIGHDWGGGHVITATLLRPDLVTTVTTDIAGVFAPGYEWHDMAQAWRTPGVGEEAIAAMASTPVEERVALYEDLGMNRRAAEACAAHAGEMGPSILALYRSADPTTLQRYGSELAGLDPRPDIHVVIATADTFTGGAEKATFSAQAWGATIHRLEGLGHWWMMQDPARAAAMVRDIVGD